MLITDFALPSLSHVIERFLNLSKSLALIFFASVLGQFLQSSGPLGPLLHFDQAGQKANKQEESQQAKQGNDGHIKRIQSVGCGKA